jgi:tetratricopeptide (TPR) repeat protein
VEDEESDQYRASHLIKLAVALARSGVSERSANVAEQAIAAASAVEAGWKRDYVVNEVASGLAEAGWVDRAVLLLENEMEDHRLFGPPKRVLDLIRLAVMLARAARIQDALFAAQRAVIARRADKDRSDWQVEREFTELALALAKAKAVDEAILATREILSRAPRAEALAKVAMALANIEEMKSARNAAMHALDVVRSMRPRSDFQTPPSLWSELCRRG